MERIDLGASLGPERDVKMRRLLLGLVQDQGNLAPWRRELDTVRRGSLRDDHDAERLECPEKERLARCKVGDAELDVVEHDGTLAFAIRLVAFRELRMLREPVSPF